MDQNNSGNQLLNNQSTQNVQPNVNAQNTQSNGQNYQQQAPNYNRGNEIPKAYKPISAWGYVGWDILFSIPIVGFIILLVFACGGTSNINRKKYARSKFCAFLLAIIVSLVTFVVLYFIFGISFTPGKYRIVL